MGVTRKRQSRMSPALAEKWGRFFAAAMAAEDFETAIEGMPSLVAKWRTASRNRRLAETDVRGRIEQIVKDCLRIRRARERGTGRFPNRTGTQWWLLLSSVRNDLPSEILAAVERLGPREILRRCRRCRGLFFVEDRGHRHCSDRCADIAYRRANAAFVREQTRVRVARFRAARRERAEREQTDGADQRQRGASGKARGGAGDGRSSG